MNIVPLKELATIERNAVSPLSVSSSTLYLGLEHIRRGGEIVDWQTVVEAGIKSTKFSFTCDHVLFGKLRPNLGKVSRPHFGGICSTDILPIRPGAQLDRGYLAHYLATPSMVTFAASLTTGANLPRLSPAALEEFPIPILPIKEQRRVAAILDQADVIRAKRRQILAQLDTLAQAIFHDMFGNPASWPGRWTMGTIGDMAQSVDYGTSAKAGSSGAWPILRMGNITDLGHLNLNDLKYIDMADSDVPRYGTKRGDLLFNRTNSKEKVGKSCVVDTDEIFMIAGYLVRVRFNPYHRPEFASAYLASDHGRMVRMQMAKKAVNQANINATEMRKIPIALPPTELQDEFVRRLRKVEAQRAVVRRALDADNELFASLQARAFRGEL